MITYYVRQLKTFSIMSLTLSNVILHKLVKNEQDELEVCLRNQTLENEEFTEALVSELHRVFNSKAGKGFGVFKTESEFGHWLGSVRKNETPFLEFSNKSAEKLKSELIKYPFAEEGILVIAEYQSLATEYLFVAVLPSNESMKVTEQLDISSTDYLDIAKMDIAARIDLSTWETNADSNRYLTFIKGRVGRKVSDFFLDFLQADVGMDTKVQNQVLMQAVEDFCADERLEKDEKQQYRKQVYDYCNGQLQAGEELTLKELSGELPTSESGSNFYQFAEEQGYELEESFPVDRTAMRKLTKFVGAGGGLSLNFDAMLLGERVFYDPETDTLTIKGTPPNLKDQLTRRLGSSES
ncbi:nucleoid-associated protein YejK [Aliivibrio finisterrensis]|uniref:Nucleoid-associated protein ERW49_01800 n=2 Tax=Vibrionaceae TaxID=641 RepID=A0A4V1Z917_9GAMM|nr:nucleoid-associated protein YejK [Aliivibrio finisterrensis]RYU52851.1 nucleoid-associated protein YejK [Aliivibrio finisterrensis]RYU54576.1 nucleoid-associated protein YejK [Aliivibrio finisterrensis]RYU57821.1 nucleoid-associated protein YejK [Aliivibrio finisterrensis]RYU65249.1 nucleoid-associated protein YejK [Aliivibrio finisterrensis]